MIAVATFSRNDRGLNNNSGFQDADLPRHRQLVFVIRGCFGSALKLDSPSMPPSRPALWKRDAAAYFAQTQHLFYMLKLQIQPKRFSRRANNSTLNRHSQLLDAFPVQ